MLATGCATRTDDFTRLVFGPFLQLSSSAAITVILETESNCTARLIWGQGAELDRLVMDKKPTTIHRLEMTGLEPGVKYGCSVEFDGFWTDTAYFATPPVGPDSRWRLAIYSDTQSRPEVHSAVVRRIIEKEPDIVMHLGDFTNDGRDHQLWAREFFLPAEPLGRSVPYIPVIGNHEHNSELFYRYFGIDTTGGKGAWYSLNIGDTHLTLLNSDFDYAAWDENSSQARWLVGDLGAHADSRWKIVAFHHPLFSSRNSRAIAPQRWLWHQLLESGNVDIAFHGHDHNYFRSAVIGTIDHDFHRNGLPYVIVGSGGGETKNVDPQDYGIWAVEQVGFVIVDISSQSLFCCAIDSAGTTIDSFTIERDREPRAEEFASFLAEMFERQLTEAIYRSEPLEITGGRLAGGVKFQFPSFFNIPLASLIEWQLSPGWRLNRSCYDNLIEPGSEVGFRFEVSARPVEYGPGPVATLKLALPDSRRAFINDRIDFHPFKIRRTDPLVAGRLEQEPIVDGVVEESEWDSSLLLDKFHATAREIPVGKLPFETSVYLGHENNTLYVAGIFLGTPNPARSFHRDRDMEETLEDEAFAVSFGCPDTSYTLILSSASSILDVRNGYPAWDMEFEYALAVSDSSWSVELAIPLDQFPEGIPARINLYRQEYGGLVSDEWNPTYRPMSRTYSVVPAYGIRYTDVTAMVELLYE